MNMKVFTEGLELIQKGISLILDEMKTEREVVSVTSNESVTTPVKGNVTKSIDATKKADAVNSEYTREELDTMTYNDLKKLAKELGMSAVGNRKEITEKILTGETSITDEPEEVKPEKKFISKTSNKVSNKSVPVDEEEDDDEIIDEEDEEEDIDPVEQQVLEVTEEMSDDDIREILEDCGISTKGKRQALIAKLVKAVNDGKIALDDSDNNENEDDDIVTEKSDKDTMEEDITSNMTKKRKKAYADFCQETKESFEEGEITREDLIAFINDFNGTKDKMKKVSDKNLLEQYFKIAANLIDDDGEIIEEGAYTINDEPYCCGRPLKYDEDENKFICEVCGEEYEGEE